MPFMDEEQIAQAKKMNLPIFICPNEDKGIIGLSDDDKVPCPCGRPNPTAPQGVQNVERRTGLHLVRFLKRG